MHFLKLSFVKRLRVVGYSLELGPSGKSVTMSSFRHYALREVSVVEIESEWTARESRTRCPRTAGKSSPGSQVSVQKTEANPGHPTFWCEWLTWPPAYLLVFTMGMMAAS